MKGSFLFLFACTISFWVSAQCPPGTNPSGIELVVNGDFQNGNTGFTSGYSYKTPPNTTEGQYWVATGAQVATWNGGMASSGDHTSGTGNFLLVNGAPTGGVDIWCQNITVTPNTQYLFSAWISTLSLGSPAIVQFYVDGSPLGPTITAPTTTGSWIPFNATWNSNNSTSISICIVNQNTSVGSNDFGLDDISFQPCGCGFTANAGGDVSVCPGNNVQLNSTAANSYSWSPSTGLSCNTCQSPVASPAVTTTYTLTAANNSGCSDTDDVVVQIYPAALANAGSDVSICKGTQASLAGSGGVTYSWQPVGGLSNPSTQNPQASPASTTTYTLTVTDANGCSATDNVIVLIFPPVNSSAGTDATVCPGLSAQLLATGGTEYSWLPSDGLDNSTISNPIATPTENETYTVTITDANNCTASETVSINVYPDFAVSISADTSVCPKEPVILVASGGSSYNWNPTNFLSCSSCSSVSATPLENITYTVTIADSYGCKEEESVAVNLLVKCVDIFMPSAFSPNKDGKNDLLAPMSTKVEKITWSVYNRWGENIFTGNSLSSAWDGTYKQKDEPVDVYVWYIQAVMKDGTSASLKGNVTLLR